MEFTLKGGVAFPEKGFFIALTDEKGSGLKDLNVSEETIELAKENFGCDISFFHITVGKRSVLAVNLKGKDHTAEAIRLRGAEAADQLSAFKVEDVYVSGPAINKDHLLLFLEGFLLASYTFSKYKSEKGLKKRNVLVNAPVEEKQLKELENLVRAVFKARDLVNEPASYLTAEKLGQEIQELAEEAGFQAEVLEKKQIESLRFGGLLAVNSGSENPPAFIVLEYKPSNAVNKKPVVLVGKGVVFDTGGLSLKPPQGMEHMKADMGGAAAVAGLFYAAASNKVNMHLIGLIPATDNRPGQKAINPGDVITIYGGKTVEVLNTDAEGRLILADALVYASKYEPELVIDLATLTGAAARAIGPEGAAMMGTAPDSIKNQLKNAGNQVHERLVEFPLWPEYLNYIKSDIADLKNVGSGDAGAITAGKFLEQFVDYPWIHLDIAGMAFANKNDGYRLKNGTGTGVRLLYHFLTMNQK